MKFLIALLLIAAMCFPMFGGAFAAKEGDDGNYTKTDQADFCGYWYAAPYLSSSSSASVGTSSGNRWYYARYLLDVDGTFVYGCDETDGLDRMRYAAGNWYIEGDKLNLEIRERLVWEGGQEVAASGFIKTEWMIENPKLMLISYGEAELETHDFKGVLSPEDLGGLETAGRYVIEIDSQIFYGFGGYEGLLGDYWEMRELADPTRNAMGVPLFEYLDDPTLSAFAANFEADFSVSVSVRYDGEAGGMPLTVTDSETVRAVFDALCQITVLGEWPVSGHTDDSLHYCFEMANGSVIYGFEFQDGMLLDK